jgi:hypothetical protein
LAALFVLALATTQPALSGHRLDGQLIHVRLAYRGYVGVKLDGDIEKALVGRFKVVSYPTMIVLDASGAEERRAVGYQSSSQVLALLGEQGIRGR